MAFKGFNFEEFGKKFEEDVIRELKAKRNAAANKLPVKVNPPSASDSNGPHNARKLGTKRGRHFSEILESIEDDVIRELILARNTKAATIVAPNVPEPAPGYIGSIPYRPPTPPRTHTPRDNKKIGKDKKGKK